MIKLLYTVRQIANFAGHERGGFIPPVYQIRVCAFWTSTPHHPGIKQVS
jgi:hypothetical protein